MDGFQAYSAIFIAACLGCSGADHLYTLSNPESIIIPADFDTKLQCVMNIDPDKFQWKFYPLAPKDASNPKAVIDLSKSRYSLVPEKSFINSTKREKSDLTLHAYSKDIAGDYQCLAYYGASVVASVPWRITVAMLNDFPRQDAVEVVVTVGNTVNWRCESPESNPDVLIDYFKDGKYVAYSQYPTKSLILSSVTVGDSGRYTCKGTNTLLDDPKYSPASLNLRVVKPTGVTPPSFIYPLKKNYVVNRGDTVFLECSAVGNPVPNKTWAKKTGDLPKQRADMVDSGLLIKNVSSSDQGVYVCNQFNARGTISHEINLIYTEEPHIDCSLNSTDIKEGETLELECSVTGSPQPQISWFLNGFVVNNDSAIEASGSRISFHPAEKRHAGNLQIFARNVVKTLYTSISIIVIPKSRNIEPTISPSRSLERSTRRPPRGKMIPPSKPTVSRVSDEAVNVRWNVSSKGLPIEFFKVQYRDLGPMGHDHKVKGSKWQTMNADIQSHIRSYEVNSLEPDHWYRFRIAAVYSNKDNKNSPNSDKFYLKRDHIELNPLPVPLVTSTEAVNSTSVRIYWKCDPVPHITIEGFYISYNSASSAADYMKATVDGNDTNSFLLSHLQPNTVYDIKLQSFNSKSASYYSSIEKARTLGEVSSSSPAPVTVPSVASETPATSSNLYVIIAVGVVVGGSIIIIIVFLLLFRKWKRKKNTRVDRDKPAEDHHIQLDGNDYVVTPKSQHRANGCVPPNRITITANPLADADNKNQNMIEMSCLSNNNSPSASGEASSPTNSKDKRHKRRIRNNKHNSVDSNTSGENYV